ncbi:MAG: MFS transporter [Terracidiphilus sp.]|nr:MFS transporter [Terracidiphilus sp.]
MTQTSSSRSLNEGSLRYAGWSVAGAAFVGVMCSFAAIVPFTFSLFLQPLHAAFGWKREAMSGAFAVAAMTVALVSPLIGLLLDRFPPRRILLPAILVFAAAMASLSGLTPSMHRFFATYFLLGLVGNGTAQFAYTRTVLTWFDRRRGLALAVVLTGSGAGSLVIPPLTQWMISTHGWRSAYVMLGCIALLGLPLTALLVRNRPEPEVVAQPRVAVAGSTISAALGTSAFWILAGIILLGAFSENGLITNLAAMLTEHGVAPAFAALALSARGGAGIVGRLAVGLFLDRFSAQRIQTVILLISAAGIVLLAYAATPAMALTGAALLGIGLGSEADVAPYLLAKYFGRRHFSMLYGLTWTAYAIGGATGPLTMGHLYDSAGGYQARFVVGMALVIVAAAGLSLLLRRDDAHEQVPMVSHALSEEA